MNRRQPNDICRAIQCAFCWRHPFIRGVLLGAILTALLFVSWRLWVAVVGILTLCFLLRKWE